MSEKLKIRTHLQVSVSERRLMPRGLTERAYNVNRPKFEFGATPPWLLPVGLPTMTTITQSIVWGIFGRMADMPEG